MIFKGQILKVSQKQIQLQNPKELQEKDIRIPLLKVIFFFFNINIYLFVYLFILGGTGYGGSAGEHNSRTNQIQKASNAETQRDTVISFFLFLFSFFLFPSLIFIFFSFFFFLFSSKINRKLKNYLMR